MATFALSPLLAHGPGEAPFAVVHLLCWFGVSTPEPYRTHSRHEGVLVLMEAMGMEPATRGGEQTLRWKTINSGWRAITARNRW